MLQIRVLNIQAKIVYMKIKKVSSETLEDLERFAWKKSLLQEQNNTWHCYSRPFYEEYSRHTDLKLSMSGNNLTGKKTSSKLYLKYVAFMLLCRFSDMINEE